MRGVVLLGLLQKPIENYEPALQRNTPNISGSLGNHKVFSSFWNFINEHLMSVSTKKQGKICLSLIHLFSN